MSKVDEFRDVIRDLYKAYDDLQSCQHELTRAHNKIIEQGLTIDVMEARIKNLAIARKGIKPPIGPEFWDAVDQVIALTGQE